MSSEQAAARGIAIRKVVAASKLHRALACRKSRDSSVVVLLCSVDGSSDMLESPQELRAHT